MSIPCRQCGASVEPEREHYATPMCFACLPPPKPLPVRRLRNRAQCLECNEVIESTYRHDYRSCKCGNLSVDGGNDYHKRSFRSGRWREVPDGESDASNEKQTKWDST